MYDVRIVRQDLVVCKTAIIDRMPLAVVVQAIFTPPTRRFLVAVQGAEALDLHHFHVLRYHFALTSFKDWTNHRTSEHAYLIIETFISFIQVCRYDHKIHSTGNQISGFAEPPTKPTVSPQRPKL